MEIGRIFIYVGEIHGGTLARIAGTQTEWFLKCSTEMTGQITQRFEGRLRKTRQPAERIL